MPPGFELRNGLFRKTTLYHQLAVRIGSPTRGLVCLLRILLFIKDSELQELQKRINRRLNFSDKRVQRIFNNSSWNQGGRFFGGWWQNVPREYRKFIRINYKGVVECDYSGLHINMLYALSGAPMPAGDVYHLPGYSVDTVFRDFVKRMLLVMVNATDRTTARKAIHKEVHLEKSLVLPDEVPSTRAVDLDPIMDAFEAKHTPIKGYFCTGVGIDLQNRDSKIAEQVLLRFSKMGCAILFVIGLAALDLGITFGVEFAGFLFDLRLATEQHALRANDTRPSAVCKRGKDVQD